MGWLLSTHNCHSAAITRAISVDLRAGSFLDHPQKRTTNVSDTRVVHFWDENGLYVAKTWARNRFSKYNYIYIISIINIWFYCIYFCSSFSERWLPDLNPWYTHNSQQWSEKNSPAADGLGIHELELSNTMPLAPPMTGNGNHATYIYIYICDDCGMVYDIVLPTLFKFCWVLERN